MSSDNNIAHSFYDLVIYKDIKAMVDILVPLVSSYRLLVGAADELNKIALVSKREAEKAISRADDLGDIIDNLQDEIDKTVKLYINEIECKLKYGKSIGFDSINVDNSPLILAGLLEDKESK